MIFVGASLLFFGALALRFAPAAWETGNRAGEFFFIGLAFVVSGAVYQALRRRGDTARWRLATALGLGVVLSSGAISGWPWDSQLARPIRVSAEGSTIDSEPLALAEWAANKLPGRRFAAPEADGRLLMTPGGQVALTGQGPDIEDIVGEPDFPSWQKRILRNHRLRYVVADRREIARDNVRGYFFTVPGSGSDGLLPAGVVHKFAAASRRAPLRQRPHRPLRPREPAMRGHRDLRAGCRRRGSLRRGRAPRAAARSSAWSPRRRSACCSPATRSPARPSAPGR